MHFLSCVKIGGTAPLRGDRRLGGGVLWGGVCGSERETNCGSGTLHASGKSVFVFVIQCLQSVAGDRETNCCWGRGKERGRQLDTA